MNIPLLNNEAIRFENLSYTYKDLAFIVEARTNALRQMGIQSETRVALLFPNCPDFIFWYFAIIRLGAIVVPLHFSLTQEEIQTLLTDCSASLLITNEEQKGRLPNHIRAFFTKETPLANETSSAHPLNEDDILAILYTSGTTGTPKGVALTYRNVRFVSESIGKYCCTASTDRLLLAIPISHCFGQNLILHHALSAGACIVLLRTFTPHTICEIIEKERVSMIFGVPTMYRLILQTPAAKKQFHWVRYCHSGAAPLTQDIAEAWLQRFEVPIHQGYGLTESAPFACYNDSPIDNPVSIGLPIEQVKIKLVNDQGEETAPGEAGEIAIQGPNVMKQYWNRPEETALSIRNGWLYTGDIGRKDAAGNLYLIDRKKDLINVSGLKVYPAEVEQILEKHPAIKEAAVFGSPDSIVGERVHAAIVLKESHQISQKELIQFCKKRLAPFKIPETFTQLSALPRNATGKLLRRHLSLSTAEIA